MKINKFILIIIVSLMILTISSVNAQDVIDNGTVSLVDDGNILNSPNDSIYLNNLNGDDRNDGKSWDSSVKTFDKALNMSSDGGTIYVSSGNYNSQGNVRINITKSVNIVGSENTTFDGQQTDYLFVVYDNVTVTFKNINFCNALKDYDSYPKHTSEGEVSFDNRYGAALEIKNADVTIEDCTFCDNQISNKINKEFAIYGAAVSNLGNLTILNSYFNNNCLNSIYVTRNGYGGSVYNKGKAVIDNSTFVNSQGKTGTFGAAIANEGILEMTNSVIDNSSTRQQSQGSAIYNTGTFTLTNSIIKNNKIGATAANDFYGAVYNSGKFTGTGNIFENNTFIRSNSLQSARYTANVFNAGTLRLTHNAFLNNKMHTDSDVSTSYFRKDVFNAGDGVVSSLNYNWWGSNEDPFAMKSINVEGVSIWLTFVLSPEYSALNINDKLTIRAALTANGVSTKLTSFPVFNTTFKTSYKNLTKTLNNGKANFVFDYTKNKGSYEVIAELTGFEQSVLIDVGKLASEIEFNATEDITYQDVFQINVTVKGNGQKIPTGKVLMSLNSKEYVIDLNKGVGTYQIEKLDKGDYTLKLTYVGDGDYAKSFANSTLHVKRLPVNLTVHIPNFKVDQIVENGEIILNTSEAQGTYKLYIDGDFVASGRIYPGSTPIKKLGFYSPGKHNVILEYEGSDNFEPTNVTTTFEITKYSTILNIYANDVNAGDDAIITIEAIPEILRGEAELYINDVKKPIFLADAITNVTLTNLEPGRYDVTVVYLGDTQYYGSNDTASFRVVKQSSKLNVTIIQKDNSNSAQIVVKTIPSKCTGVVGVYVNFKNYKLNLTRGVARFNVELDKGTNYIFVYYEGDEKYEGCDWNTTIGFVTNFELLGANVTAYEHNDFEYVIRLVEESGVPIQFVTVSVKLDGKTYDVTTDKLGFGILPLNLAKGIYEVVATYENESITNVLTINEIKYNLTVDNFDYGTTGTIETKFNEDVRGNVHFLIKGILDETIPIVDGIASVNISGLNAANYRVYATYTNEYYKSSIAYKTFKVKKVPLKLSYSFNQHDYTITVDNLANATGNMTFKIDDNVYTAVINNSKATLNLNTLSKGNHALVINYTGDQNYKPAVLKSKIFIKELTTDINVNIKNGIYGKNLTVTATIDKNATGIVRFDVEDISKEVAVKNGVAKWIFSGIDAGTHNIMATYLGNDYYIDVSNSTSFKVSKSSSKIVLYVNEVYLDENIRIYANLSVNATGKVLYSMDGYYSPRYKATADSKSMWYISPLDTGSYTIRATFEGDNNYYASSTVFILNVTQKRALLEVEIEDVNMKDRVIANFKLTNKEGKNLDGIVNLQIGSKSYEVEIEDGESTLVIGKLPVGNFSYTAKYEGDDVYGRTSSKGSFEVRESRLNVTILCDGLTKYYKNGKNLTVTLVTSKNKVIPYATVVVTISGKGYPIVTDSEGVASLEINLRSGTFEALLTYEGDEDYFSASKNVTINVLATVEGIDVVKVYGTSTQYYAIFADSNGKPLANKAVKFTIGSNTYTATTLANGIVRLNINLNVGTYTITAINPVTAQRCSNKIVIVNRLMENKDLTKYFCGPQNYTVKAYTDDGKAATNVDVQITVNGKTYSVKTDDKGYATLGINLKPGKYTIKAAYKGYSVTNTVTVKSTIVTSDLSKKKSATTSFQAKLLDTSGKILKGQTVVFKFNGKNYSIKTNSNGIATLTIKTALKVGTYRIYTTYGKLTVANTITIK